MDQRFWKKIQERETHRTVNGWDCSIFGLSYSQTASKIPLHLSQIFLVVYLEVPSLAHFFSLFILLLLALSSLRTQSNTTSMLMTPSCTFLSLLRIQLLHLKYSPVLSLTYSPGWTLTNCSSIHPNWIPSYWYKTTMAQIFSTHKFISRQWYHPSQLFCS